MEAYLSLNNVAYRIKVRLLLENGLNCLIEFSFNYFIIFFVFYFVFIQYYLFNMFKFLELDKHNNKYYILYIILFILLNIRLYAKGTIQNFRFYKKG